MKKIFNKLKTFTFIDYLWSLLTLLGCVFFTISLTGISAYLEQSGRAKGGWAIFGKVEDGHYYFGVFGNYIEVSRSLYIKSASYSMLTALFLSLSVILFSWTRKAKIEERKLMATKGANRSDKYIFLVVCILIGGFIFLKSLLCLVKA
jgi:hypothetical protein